ncbi:MAG: gluconokinase [Thermotogae bacterium]|jgi:gluconokinase|nr:gluconokinase [Thermotogota bacterium]MCL5032133.1 gluconokinase [Thermotogota bacterium]
MKYLIGTDIGTTATKTVAYDLNGRAIFKSEVCYKLLMPKIGMIEQDPDEIFDSVLDSIEKVVRQIGKDKIAGISFSGAMHSVIPVDKNGDKLMNAVIWADTRSSQIAKDLRKSGEGFAIYKNTGTPIHPMLPLCKIIWLKSNKSIFEKTSKFISIKEYIFYKLFGLYVIDHSMASGTGFLNLKNMKWDDTALRIAGINENMLSEIVPVDHVFKGIKDLYAAKIGIDPEVPFIIGGADGPLANLGSGAVQKGISSVSVGTSGAMRVVSDSPVVDRKMRTFTYVLDESHFTIGGAVSNAGMVVKWFMDNFGGKIDSTMTKASKIKAGSDGLVFLPHLTGERSPYWDASLRGVFFGMNIYHKKPHFLRATLEGIGYSLYDVDLALEEITGKIDEVHLSGGMTRSKLWIKILADVLGKKVLTMKNDDSSAFGAVIVGMKALKIIDNFDEVKNFFLISKTYFPDAENHDVYMKIFEIYKMLHDDLKKDFENIVEFQEGSDKDGTEGRSFA